MSRWQHVVVLGSPRPAGAMRFARALLRADDHRADRTGHPSRLAFSMTTDSGYIDGPRSLAELDTEAYRERVVARLGAVALEAMGGAVYRGTRTIQVVLPSHSLAPVAWSLARSFTTASGVRQLLRGASVPPSSGLHALVSALRGVRVRFPTLPEVALGAWSPRPLLLLGTPGVGHVYRRAAGRLRLEPNIVELSAAWQDAVLDAARASRSSQPADRPRARAVLDAVVREARSVYGDDLVVLEAWADLDYGIGTSAHAVLAEQLIDEHYQE